MSLDDRGDCADVRDPAASKQMIERVQADGGALTFGIPSRATTADTNRLLVVLRLRHPLMTIPQRREI